MSDTFKREPINHGDANVWHDYVMSQIRRGGLGGLSMELYDNGGALTLSPGYAGIDDGVTKGTIERTAAGAISIAAIANSHWATVEASVSGAVVTYTVTEVDGTEGEIPASVKAAYDYMKAGYYLTASKRLIGIAFKTSGGALGRIVNCESGKLGFKKIQTIIHRTSAGVETVSYVATKVIDIGDWNMDLSDSIDVSNDFWTDPVTFEKIRSVSVWIRMDASYSMGVGDIYGGPLSSSGSFSFLIAGSLARVLRLSRTASGGFDNTNYDSTSYDRGWITIEYET